MDFGCDRWCGIDHARRLRAQFLLRRARGVAARGRDCLPKFRRNQRESGAGAHLRDQRARHVRSGLSDPGLGARRERAAQLQRRTGAPTGRALLRLGSAVLASRPIEHLASECRTGAGAEIRAVGRAAGAPVATGFGAAWPDAIGSAGSTGAANVAICAGTAKR